MINIKGIKFKRIKYFFVRLPKNMAQKPFLAFFVLLLVALIFGGLTFYLYSGFGGASIEIGEEQLKFDRATYQKVLSEWQERNETISEIGTKEYPNPFKALTPQ